MSKVICIGGPLDKSVVDRCGDYFDYVVDGKDNPVFSGTHHKYHLRYISADGEEAICFYTHDGLGEYAAIVRVFTAYAKAKK